MNTFKKHHQNEEKRPHTPPADSTEGANLKSVSLEMIDALMIYLSS